MHKFDRDGELHRKKECYRTLLFAIGTFCAIVFLASLAMVAQTPKPVFLGQKIPVRTMPKPVPVKLGR